MPKESFSAAGINEGYFLKLVINQPRSYSDRLRCHYLIKEAKLQIVVSKPSEVNSPTWNLDPHNFAEPLLLPQMLAICTLPVPPTEDSSAPIPKAEVKKAGIDR